MKTKLKSIIAYHMAVGHRVAAAMVCALVAVGLSAFAADPSVTVGEVTAGEPWSTITVDYSLGGLDAATDYKVAFDITAGGQAASVTNDATKLTDGAATKEIDTAKLFGKQVVDTKAKVKVSLIAIKASSEPEYVVMKMGTGEGAYTLKWATKNLGAEKVTDSGDYFAWGETAPYYEGTGGWPATPTWKTGKGSGYAWQSYCGSSSFSEWSTPPYDATTKILKPEFDAAAQTLGNGWRTPTSEEFKALAASCVWWWTTDYNSTGKAGYIVYKAKNDADKGKINMNGTWKKWDGSSYISSSVTTESYSISDIHIFFPIVGRGDGTSILLPDTFGYYLSSSLDTSRTDPDFAFCLYLSKNNVNPLSSTTRCLGFSVRPVKEVK